MRFRSLAATLVLLLLPVSLRAQATVTVSVSDPVYRDLDRLFGEGLVKTMVVGQRPYSRREIARIILAAQRPQLGYVPTESDRRIIARLAREYAPELRMLSGDTALGSPVTLYFARAEVLGTNSPRRAIPGDSTGHVEADVNPLLDGREGRVYRVGANAAAEMEVAVRAARSLVFRVDPRVVANLNAGEAFAQGSIQAATATLLVRNIMADVGRQEFVWGQGMEGGLLGSTSGRPLDMVRIASDTPFYLWPFGPARATVTLTDLGTNQRFPHSRIVAYKLGGVPWTWRMEFGVSVFAEEGGQGAPAATLSDRLVDVIPLLKYTISKQNRNQFSNKFAGWEYRLRLPELSGLQLYAEHQFDDMDPRRWWSTLWQDGGHIAGFSFARLGAASDWSMTGEFHHTGLRYYKHNPFTTGIAFNRTLLGDPLGNQGNAGYLRLEWNAGGASALSLNGAIERRGGDIYTALVDGVPPNETNFRFARLQARPQEWRHRVTATWTYRPDARWRAFVDAGYERATHYEFVQDASRNSFVASARIELLPW